MSTRFDSIPNRRTIIDRRALSDSVRAIEAVTSDPAARRAQCIALVREALKAGRAELKRRIADTPSRGSELAASYAFLTHQLLRVTLDFATQVLYPLGNPTPTDPLPPVPVRRHRRGPNAAQSICLLLFPPPLEHKTAAGGPARRAAGNAREAGKDDNREVARAVRFVAVAQAANDAILAVCDVDADGTCAPEDCNDADNTVTTGC